MTASATIDAQMLASSALVVAHPDDEVLWFGSVLPQIGRVIVAFRECDSLPGIGARRAAALAELPYRDLRCLDLPEADSLCLSDWSNPAPDAFGLGFRDAAGAAAARYRGILQKLRGLLRQELAGCSHVFTHNPWGEYGHEDHVQLFRVVESLRGELGFDQWCSTYCARRSEILAGRYPGVGRSGLLRRAIDRAFAGQVADIYRKHDCWTWHADWSAPLEECLVAVPADAAAWTGASRAVPLTYVSIPTLGISAPV